jgi:hypothetical protein
VISLGDRIEDIITGAKGIATGKTIWLTGCVRIGISVGFDKAKGEEILFWADEERCRVVQHSSYKKAQMGTNAAGPQPNPKQVPDPR